MTGIADRTELLQILTVRARDGNVGAAKTLLEELRRDDESSDSVSELDKLDSIADNIVGRIGLGKRAG